MAGLLRFYDMPNLTPAAKKRERTDGQDQLWKTLGLEPLAPEPVEGKPEEQNARKALDNFNLASGKKNDLETEKARNIFEYNVKQAIDTREASEDPDPLWDQVVKTYNDLQEASTTKPAAEVEKIFEKLKDAYSAFIQQKPSNKKQVIVPENIPLGKTIEFAQNVLQMGLSYVHEFVGMLGTRLGDRDTRIYYKWNQKGALELEGVENIEDLIRKNMHLGREMCAVILDQYKKFAQQPLDPVPLNKLIGDGDLDRIFGFTLQTHGDALDELLSTSGIEDQTGGFVTGVKKEWVFGLLDLAAFAHILSVGTMGAMSLAVGQIRRIRGCGRFTLKQLLMSDGVRDIFAVFVAFQYLMSSGGNAYAGRSSSQGNAKGTTFMLSAGLETRKMLYAQIETAQYWFQDVYETTNPLYTQLKTRKETLEMKRTDLKAAYSTKYDVGGEALINRIDAILLNRGTKIIEDLEKELEIIKRRESASGYVEGQRYVENVRDVYRLAQLLEKLPEKILRHAN